LSKKKTIQKEMKNPLTLFDIPDGKKVKVLGYDDKVMEMPTKFWKWEFFQKRKWWCFIERHSVGLFMWNMERRILVWLFAVRRLNLSW